MSIDIEKLKRLLAEWNQSKPSGIDRRSWEQMQRLKHGELSGEAVNALPQLLAIAEAAMAWRDDPQRPGHHPPWHLQLMAAVDAARKAGT